MISNFLFILLSLFILVYIVKNFFKGKYFILNFESLFTLGFIYYLMLPYYFLIFTKSNTVASIFPGVAHYAVQVSEFNKIIFVISIFVLYLSFMCFSKLHVFKSNEIFKIKSNTKRSSNRNLFIVYFIFVFFICLFFTYKFKGQLGKGYTEADNMEGGKGSFISFSLILYILSFLIIKPTTKTFHRYTFIYFIFALLIMTMGGRIYFLTTLLTTVIFIVTYKRKIKIRTIFFLTLVVAILFSVIGVVRQGSDISVELVMYIFLGEPILTSYSLFSCLSSNVLPLVNFPSEIVFGLVNLIPSFIFKDKVAFIAKFTMMSGINYISPGGAENIFTSLMVNFGVLGIPIFAFFISYFLKVIKNLNVNLYIFSTSWFVFTFFREPFYTSIIKILFEICFLLPVILFLLNNFTRYSSKKGQAYENNI